MSIKHYQFEIYTKNPTTGESGWEIKFRNVAADSFERAKEILRGSPHYDVTILLEFRDTPCRLAGEAVWDSKGGYGSDAEPSAPYLTWKNPPSIAEQFAAAGEPLGSSEG
jgi:hypothetical protein